MKEKEEEKVKKPGKGLRHYGKRTVRKIRGKRTNVFIFLDKFEICQDLIGGKKKIMEKSEKIVKISDKYRPQNSKIRKISLRKISL